MLAHSRKLSDEHNIAMPVSLCVQLGGDSRYALEVVHGLAQSTVCPDERHDSRRRQLHREKFSAEHVVRRVKAAGTHFPHCTEFVSRAPALRVEKCMD